ncbi:MAG: putative Nudix hydrolase NudL [Gemmatimonadaceae bacterium]|nr:putative Nudix hydrolase NudL [Gemmatimonadaceae bacterium]
MAEHPGRMATFEGDPARAAVALIFRPSAREIDLLMIRRAEREGDPWSGNIALPGGRSSRNDASLVDTAMRETWEETGVDLRRNGHLLGMLDELHPRTPVLPPIVVSPYVFTLAEQEDRAVGLVLNDEVADAFWVPLATLADPRVSRETEIRRRNETWRVPAFVIHDHVVWGMTERILRNLLHIALDPDD